MERIARRCKDPKSKGLQRLGLVCFHHEGLADMRPSFNREPGTMVERCTVMRGDRSRNAAERSFALRDAGLVVTGGRWLGVTGHSETVSGCAQPCITQL